MEEEKNSAVEKVEKTTKPKAKAKKSKTTKKKAQNNVKKTSSPKVDKKEAKLSFKEKLRARMDKMKADRQRKKAEREEVQAAKRIELAKIKAEKKTNREKIRAQKEKERAKHRLEAKRIKAEKQAERKTKKDMHKHETKQEKIKRKKAEKQEKLRIRREKHLKKAEIKREKAQAKHERKMHKQQNKTKGFGGWLAAVISLGVTVLVLASVLTMTFFIPNETDGALQSSYARAYSGVVGEVDELDVDLSKVMATKDLSSMQKYLVDVAIASELAENDLGELPLMDETKYYTARVLNQIGDFAKYLNEKIADGKKLSAEDYKNLKQLYNANKQLQEGLKEISADMGEDYDFTKLMDQSKNDKLLKGLNELQNLSADYPELIYDGAFSDSNVAEKKEVKGLSGEEITKDEAQEIFVKLFGEYKLSKIEEAGQTDGIFTTYNFMAKADGNELFAQISKKGGKLITFTLNTECNNENIEEDNAVFIGIEYLSSLGIENMRPVWANDALGQVTVNYAYIENDVIVYPDLIKIVVCKESGKVIGMEASNYYSNHTERSISKATITAATAKTKISSDISILTTRLAMIPIGNSETLAYEIYGEMNNENYYVYIDATTGRQVEMFKVIGTNQGKLLI